MDSRTARRTAEKSARDLILRRASLIGELGVARAQQGRLEQDVEDAAAKGQQLVRDAETEAAGLVAAARELAQSGSDRYNTVYDAAIGGGWSREDLQALGFLPHHDQATAVRRRSTRRAPTPQVQAEHGEDAGVASS